MEEDSKKGPRVTVFLSKVTAEKPFAPSVSNVLLFAKFRLGGFVRVVSDFVKQHHADDYVSDELKPQPPRLLEDAIYENLDPCWIAFPLLVIEPQLSIIPTFIPLRGTRIRRRFRLREPLSVSTTVRKPTRYFSGVRDNMRSTSGFAQRGGV
jgi:hypothetical protein